MVGLGLGTSKAMVDSLAPVPCTLDNMSTPTLELRCAVDGVNAPWWQPGGVGVESAHQRGESAQLGHAQSSFGCGAQCKVRFERGRPIEGTPTTCSVSLSIGRTHRRKDRVGHLEGTGKALTRHPCPAPGTAP